jgi:membrane-associated phospholipid phosphatase
MTRTRWTTAGFAILTYAAMWVGYPQGWWHGMDFDLLGAAHNVGVHHPGWVRFWVDVSSVLDPLHLLVVFIAVAACLRSNVRVAGLLLACGPLSADVTMFAKDIANRHRPSTMLAAVPGTSFPSGHSLETAAMLLALTAVAWPVLSRGWRRVALVVAGSGILMVGTARVALNVHHPSDVLAGWALGYLLFLVAWLTFRPDKEAT